MFLFQLQMNAESPGSNRFPSEQGPARDFEGPDAHHLFQNYTSTVSENQAFVIWIFKHTPRYFILSYKQSSLLGACTKVADKFK